MKKFLLSILTSIYLLLSTGVSIELHYCMGKFAGVDFSWTKDEHCSRCGMIEKKSGCCLDEVKFYKFEDSFKSVEYSFSATKFMDDVTAASYFATGEVVHSLIQQIHVNPANLPVYTGPPIYLQNRVFRI